MCLADIANFTEDQAREYFEQIHWKNGVVCHHCGCMDVTKLQGKAARPGVYQCNEKSCRKQFTVTTNTIMERSHIPLKKWLLAFHLMCSSKKGISALQLQRELGLKSYKSAWHLAHRIRLAMNNEPMATMLKGDVEADESYFGGKPRYKGTSKRGRGTKKTAVFLVVQRNGEARAQVIERVRGKDLKKAIKENVHKDSIIHTDEFPSYKGLDEDYAGHKVVNHSAKQYVDGTAHTNTAESYFSLMKRGVIGAFHHISKHHLHRYCSEFEFRWNNRKVNDSERREKAIGSSVGKRLMYKQPISEKVEG